MTKLYPIAKRILKILWVNDDLIFQEDLEKLQVLVAKLTAEWDPFPKALALRDALQQAGDSVGQEELFELQDAAFELAFSIAHWESETEDLAKSFPWLLKIV